MFIASKNNILIPGGKDRDDVRIPRGFVGEVPGWLGGTAYFKALVQCGKITLPEDGGKKPLAPVPKSSKGKRTASNKDAKESSSIPAPGRDKKPSKDPTGKEAPAEASAGEPGKNDGEAGADS